MNFSAIKTKLAITGLAVPVLTLMFLSPRPSQATSVPQNEGESMFKAKCTACHGAFGSGSTVIGKQLNLRDLRSEEVQKLSDAQLYEIIAKGRNKMPGFEKSLGEEK